MQTLTPVVKGLLLVNISAYVLTAGWDLRLILALFPPGSELFRWYQPLSHFFMHGNLTHLLFNMFALFMFGPILEQVWGSRRFIVYYFCCALGAILCQMLVWYTGLAALNPVLGASGAVYGLFVGFAMLFPNHRIMLLIPPIPLPAKYMILVLVLFDLTLGLSGAASGIAHFAHLGGALAGALFVLWWRRTNTQI